MRLLIRRLSKGRQNRVLIAVVVVIVVAGIIGGYLYAHRGTDSPGDLVEQEISHLEELVTQNPENTDARVQLAVYYSKAKDYSKAIAQIKEVLRLDDTHQGALIVLGDIYMEQGRYRDAVDPYSKVVGLNQDNPMRHASMQMEAVYYWLGVAYLELGEDQNAAEQLHEALAIAPTDADAFYNLGKAYLRLGELEHSIAALKKAVSYVPNYEEAYLALEECYKQKGDEGMAEWARAMMKYSRQSYPETIQDLRDLLLQLPHSPDVYFGLGLAYESSGQPEMAVEAYRNTLKADPEHWLARQRVIALGGGEE